MELVTAREMREIDRRAVEVFGLSVEALMEQAGYHVAAVAASLLGRDAPPGVAGTGPVAVVAGKGNNGGDGLVAARYLHQWGVPVRVFLLADPGEPAGAWAVNRDRLSRLGVPLEPWTREEDVRDALSRASLIVDALLGTGFRPPLEARLAAAIRAMNAAGRPVLAVDLPSGLDADSGRPAEECVRAAATVTFCRPKLGLVLEPGAERCGAVAVAPIPIPEEAVGAQGVGALLLTESAAARLLPPRPPTGHKGTFGHVLVVAGAAGYQGAAALAALGALRGGAGLVTLACPRGVAASLAGRFPEVMVRPFPGDDAFAPEAAEGVAALAREADALCAGPGLGRRPETGDFLRRLLSGLDRPLVLDADGLNLLDLGFVAGYAGPAVLTPHPGEMARLLGTSIEAVQRDRPAAAREAARRAAPPGTASPGDPSAPGAGGGTSGPPRVCVLKGPRTLVAGADGRLQVSPVSSDALATAGTGDVLAGLIASLMGQGAGAAEAAAAGVLVHGLAGAMAARGGSTRSVTAGDVLASLGRAFRRVESAGAGDGRHRAAGMVIWLPQGRSVPGRGCRR